MKFRQSAGASFCEFFSMPTSFIRRPTSGAKRVALVTLTFTAVVCILAALVFVAVADMRDKANDIDDARAVHAAKAAIRSFQTRLGSTVRDNAIWDDAYAHMSSADGPTWVYDNWGKTSEDYPLYDVAIVLTPNGGILSAYKKGVEFAPFTYFGGSLFQLATDAVSAGKKTVSTFISTDDGTYLASAGAIQPYSDAAQEDKLNTLVFAKLLSESVVSQLDDTFDIQGLGVVAAPHGGQLSTPLLGKDGRAVSYFEWPSRMPGTAIFQVVRPYLFAAGALLVIFLIAIVGTGISAVRALQRDATAAKYKACHDALTGLLNRAGLLEAIDKTFSTNSRLALGLIDLDGFKGVNDAWGHAVGDELIKLVAGRLQSALPRASAITRLGGDEFAFLIGAKEIAQASVAVVREMQMPFRLGGRTIEVGASIGTTCFDSDVSDGFELLRRADLALYRAKEDGRGRVVEFARHLDLERTERSAFEEKLRDALAQKKIYPVFQPLVDAGTGVLRGFEALARWEPETGPVSPEIFIRVAERAGLIDELGRSMLQMSIEAARAWPDIGLSVNVSPLQLKNPDFAGQVEQILSDMSFDPRRLTLEITEGVLMSNPEQANRTINRLKACGIKFALDDFGCGYASIGALRQFGFDRMKIDRSLVVAFQDEQGAGILDATLSLAKALDIPVTAEGVETQEQADTLLRYGCDQIQGYLVGKPMSADQLEVIFFRPDHLKRSQE
jgi:diguanylate cyclase (GGDEF)-like protein